jgi:predicted phosphoribosyltransferase
MITEFTDSVAVADLPTAKWKKPGPGQLDDIDSFFTPKDWMALESIYRELHEITPAELEAITGKAVPLSEA